MRVPSTEQPRGRADSRTRTTGVALLDPQPVSHDVFEAYRSISTYDKTPRLRTPALLLGGRYDMVLPLEKHFVFEAGHIPPRIIRIRGTLDWLDKYLGSVKAR